MWNLSSWTRDGTCARPCSLNHQTTRKSWIYLTTFFFFFFFSSLCIFIIFVCTGSSLLRMGFSLVVASRVYALVAALELLTAVSPLIVEHRLQAHGLQQLQHVGSVEAHRLSCSAACGIFPDQGLNPCALEKEMATHSSVLAWRIPGMGEPGGLPSMGSHRVGHD